MLNNRESGIGNKRIKNFLGFTLVETVFVIAIIGILLAIIMPVVSSMRDKTRKLQDVANLKRIAEAYKIFKERKYPILNEFWLGFTGAHKLFDMKFKAGKDACVINDPYAYISPGDKYASKVVKETIAYWNGRHFWDNDAYEEIKTELSWYENAPVILLSYAVITCTSSGSNLLCNMPQDTTPLAFTRGLMTNGKWHEKYGLYGSSGGYVIYCDGHVTWFDGSRPAKFLKLDGSGWTSDIREALPGDRSNLEIPLARIQCGSTELKGDPLSANHFTDEEGNILLLSNFCTGGEM